MPRFRVTDEIGWEYRFEARTPVEVARGIRAAWEARISETWPGAHPALRFRVRMSEITAWLLERQGRAGATEEQRRSWNAQADHWRITASRDMGERVDLSPLRIHVQDHKDRWLTFGPPGRGAHRAWRVVRVMDLVTTTAMLEGAAEMLEYSLLLDGLSGFVGEEIRKMQYPTPVLVPPPRKRNPAYARNCYEWWE